MNVDDVASAKVKVLNGCFGWDRNISEIKMVFRDILRFGFLVFRLLWDDGGCG